jgi:flagellar basal body-associated protein FliL
VIAPCLRPEATQKDIEASQKVIIIIIIIIIIIVVIIIIIRALALRRTCYHQDHYAMQSSSIKVHIENPITGYILYGSKLTIIYDDD